jgi:integrase/recombinase XerC/integrase/recombinase XerD
MAELYADTVKRFTDHLSARGLDHKTITSYEGALNRLLKFMGGQNVESAPSSTPTQGGAGGVPTPIQATQLDVSNFKRWLVANFKSGTVDLTLKLVNAFYRWTTEQGITADNPVEFVERPSLSPSPIKWLTTEEQNAVLRESRRVHCGLNDTPTDTQRADQLREYTIILTFLRAGLRVEELCDLKLSDVVITPRKGHVAVKGKGDKDRTVPLSKELRAVLERYMESRRDNPSPFLFPSRRSEQSTTRAIQHMVEGYAERLNMPHLTCHTLRHTFGHDLAKAHIPLDVIAKLMGHFKKDGRPNITTTMIYTNPGMADLEDAVETIAWN